MLQAGSPFTGWYKPIHGEADAELVIEESHILDEVNKHSIVKSHMVFLCTTIDLFDIDRLHAALKRRARQSRNGWYRITKADLKQELVASGAFITKKIIADK